MLVHAALVNFVNPDLLGSVGTFRRIFGEPISRSRDRNATPEEVALGQQRSAELGRRVDAFMLRRTKEINAAYLPPLHSFVVFCPPSPLQVCWRMSCQSQDVHVMSRKCISMA
jgi:DNA repair and recombination protein RAD54B